MSVGDASKTKAVTKAKASWRSCLFEFILNTINEGGVAKIHRLIFAGMQGKRLSEMKPFEKGIIDRIDCEDGALALIEMGCCPGEEVEVAHVAPRRGPMAIVSGGRKVALRRSAAALLWVRPLVAVTESVLSTEHAWA
tara:strand:+ start:146 stop:559 length:414 start_codon:yes stop_codon:yes gene_type:complete